MDPQPSSKTMGAAYLIFCLAVAVATAFVMTIHQWLKAESDLAARP